MRSSRTVQWLFIFLLLLTGATAAGSIANTLEAAESNTIRVEAGETLEITTDTASTSSEYSWVLTKDRKFQMAQRTKFFQTRLIEPGTYVLDVTLQDPLGSQSGYRAFTIVVTEPSGSVPVPSGSKEKPLSAVLKTVPSTSQGTVYIPAEGGVLKIDPSSSNGRIATYHIDLDTSVDSDGDDDPANDIDNSGTIAEKSGTPVYVFMLPKNSPREIRLTVTDLAIVEPAFSDLAVSFGGTAQSEYSSSVDEAVTSDSPIRIEQKGATVRFSTARGEQQDTELLYEWDFGDRSKSLLFAPVNTYKEPGSYTVSLSIRDIATAQVLYEGVRTVEIADEYVETSSSSSEASVTSSVPTEEVSGSSGFSLKGILQVMLIIVLLLGLAIGLYLLLTWIKRKTATGLQKTLEKMEGTLVKKGDVSEPEKPAVMKLKKDAPPTPDRKSSENAIADKEKAKPDFRTQTRTNETPSDTSGPVPSWLAKASSKPMPTPAPKPQPPAAPEPKMQTATPSVTPAVSSTPKQAPQEAPAVPAWLKPTQAPPAAPLPKPPVPVAPRTEPKPPAPPKFEPKPLDDAPEVPVAVKPVAAPKPVSEPKEMETPVQAPVKAPAEPKPKPAPEVAAAPVPSPTPVSTPVTKPQEIASAPKKPEPAKIVPKELQPTPVVQESMPSEKVEIPKKDAAEPTVQEKPVVQVSKPAPAPAPTTTAESTPDDDEPIAIIKADSISKD